MGASLLIAFIFGWKLAFVVVSFLPLIVISGMVQGRIIRGANKGGKKAIEEGGKVTRDPIVAFYLAISHPVRPKQGIEAISF